MRKRSASLFLALWAVAGCRKSGGATHDVPDGAVQAPSTENSLGAAGIGTDAGRSTQMMPHAMLPARPADCRAIVVTGDAAFHDPRFDPSARTPLHQGDLVGKTPWFEVSAGGKVTLKWTESGRELTVTGPALVRACGGGDEEVLLAKGVVTSSIGAGVRPGADVWVASPLGLVRWGDATLRVEVTPSADRMRVQTENGALSVSPARGVAPACPKVLSAGTKCELSVANGPAKQVLAARLREACVTAAEEAWSAGASVLAGQPDKDAGTLGERTARHIEARQKARGACMTAIAAAAEASAPDDFPHTEAGLAAADKRWRGPYDTLNPAQTPSAERIAN